ncbi:MAG: AbrB/MazE/SpoVT family DNA-binding domain-containing protein [Candidatus Margulisbacteria bacterium]|jgi:antitoxin MazE|nr:AbrB/MazE/SpoVT family DNA-binding domain-containing protein [Candidatus Margulisiibacteriota bacterium]
MLIPVVQIGNSRGIRLPKNILRELSIEDEVQMEVHDDELVLKGVEKKPRQGWDAAFAKAPETKTTALLLPEYLDDQSFEWVW